MGYSPSNDAQDRSKIESQVKEKIAAADEAFVKGQYSTVLAIYLEAYALVHRFLHPDFPVRVAVKIPDLMAKVKTANLT